MPDFRRPRPRSLVPLRRLAAPLFLLAAIALIAAGCGDDTSGSGSGQVPGDTLAIYSSLPLHGPQRTDSQDVIRGEKLALEQAGGKVGKFKIEYTSLDDATEANLGWEPGQVASNAQKAVQNERTIAYLGELDSEATAISVPIMNSAGILQVSPTATAIGLTESAAGAERGEPEKHYPSGKRNFARVIPNDTVQCAAQVDLMREQGVRRLFVVTDRDVYGRGLGACISARAEEAEIEIVGRETIDPTADDFTALTSEIRDSQADGLFAGSTLPLPTAQLFAEAHRALPALKLFAPHELAEPVFTRRLGAAAQRTLLTSPVLPESEYPPAARAFFTAYERAYRRPAGPYAIFGYETMAAVLEAIRNAGAEGNGREKVQNEFRQLEARRSVLGTYSIDENGDTTLTRYGVYRVGPGGLVFVKAVEPGV